MYYYYTAAKTYIVWTSKFLWMQLCACALVYALFAHAQHAQEVPRIAVRPRAYAKNVMWNPISSSNVSLLKLLHMMLRNNIIIIIVKYGDCEPPQVINWEQEGYPHNMHQYMMVCLIDGSTSHNM